MSPFFLVCAGKFLRIGCGGVVNHLLDEFGGGVFIAALEGCEDF